MKNKQEISLGVILYFSFIVFTRMLDNILILLLSFTPILLTIIQVIVYSILAYLLVLKINRVVFKRIWWLILLFVLYFFPYNSINHEINEILIGNAYIMITTTSNVLKAIFVVFIIIHSKIFNSSSKSYEK